MLSSQIDKDILLRYRAEKWSIITGVMDAETTVMTETLSTPLTQRADYTQKHNAKTGRYGWLRLTPAYSLKVVNEILGAYDDDSGMHVFDPFCGTGTTAFCATYHGRRAVTTDINPFLVWLSRAKTDYYPTALIDELRQRSWELAAGAMREDAACAPLPCMHNIERWWNPDAIRFLCRLKGTIDAAFRQGTKGHSLLLAAFCRTLINLSNASFNHQSMSFKSDNQALLPLDFSLPDVFVRALDFILEGTEHNPISKAQVLKYFDDMWNHFRSLTGVLNDGARIHYIVGNSTFYGVLVSVERVYAEMLSELGFNDVECVPIRKRNSKKELIEFDVRARWR